MGCTKDKINESLAKMLQLCKDTPGGGSWEPCSEVVASGKWEDFASHSQSCSARWPYLKRVYNGIMSDDTQKASQTLAYLQATIAWAYPQAKGQQEEGLSAAF